MMRDQWNETGNTLVSKAEKKYLILIKITVYIEGFSREDN